MMLEEGCWAEGPLALAGGELNTERSPGREKRKKKTLTCAIFHNKRCETLMGSEISKGTGSLSLHAAHETQQQHAI